ncbi:hypothetical protein GH733_011310, partial [Mirounga leonina]
MPVKASADSSLGLALSVDLSMLRRKPTRLELKLDDIEEFESIRKDLETRKKQKEEVDVVGISDGEGAIGLSSDPKSREQMINDRIGYKPQPKPNNRSSQFGTEEEISSAGPSSYCNAEVAVVGHEDEHEEVADDHLDDMQHCLQE